MTLTHSTAASTIYLAQWVGGWAMLHATPGVPWHPHVVAGERWSIVDASGQEVGAIVRPGPGGAVIVEGVVTWTTAQLDFDGDGQLGGLDAARWLALYEQQSPLCDFDANGQVNADDRTLWRIAVEAARPEYSVECDVDRNGWINSADEELFTAWFIEGDIRADIIPDSFLTGEDWERFMDFYVNGTNGTGER